MAILPKFSIRQLLLFMIVVGGLSACLAGAARGDSVGFGLSVGIGALVIPTMVFSAAYWVLNAVALGSEAFYLRGKSVEVVLAEEVHSSPSNDPSEFGNSEATFGGEDEGLAAKGGS